MTKKLGPEQLSCIDEISEYCKNYKGINLPNGVKKNFLKVVFDYYDQDGPGSFKDIKSEIYVFDKAIFAFDFFQKHGFYIYEIASSDLYMPHKFRSHGYKKAYSHTEKMLASLGESNDF